ncbi:MAG: hypothetical protein FJ088_07910, partial [Deltaproteobacteria bacterium]|nr:hypothetical protein [Deltaproteobacteria bacterium]
MIRTLFTAFLIMASAACGPSAGSGGLKVRWQIAGWNCLEAEVATVEIQILRNDETVETATEDCSKLEYAFSDLGTGTYGVKVTGSNVSGKKT